jgi:hypothetical protein
LLEVKNNMKEIANEKYTWNHITIKYTHMIYAFGLSHIKKSERKYMPAISVDDFMRYRMFHMENTHQFFE